MGKSAQQEKLHEGSGNAMRQQVATCRCFRCEPTRGLDCVASKDEAEKAWGVDGSSCVGGLELPGYRAAATRPKANHWRDGCRESFVVEWLKLATGYVGRFLM